MWPLRSFIAGLAGALTAATVLAGEIPAPVKKPRDQNGAVVTKPQTPGPASAKLAPAPPVPIPSPRRKPDTGEKAAATLSSKPANKSAKHDAAVPTKDLTKEQPKDQTALPAQDWTQEGIELAKAHCNAVLAGIDAVTVPELAFRDGECGAPAPVRLISIGKSPQVAIDPPALLTCDMVVGLDTWMKKNLQPLAKKHLGSEIIKIETMSDYSCRNAYGRTGGKLSEHGHANALDIRGFVTAKAQTAYVLESWGPIQREILAAKAAAEKAAADKAVAEQAAAAATVAAGKPGSTGVSNNPSAPAAKGTLIDGLPAFAATPNPSGAKDKARGTALGFEPAHLGGPKDKDKDNNRTKKSRKSEPAEPAPESRPESKSESKPDTAASVQPSSGTRTSAFLHAAHDAACQIFGTTLGPEANNDHRNHFHVDMAPRKTKKICD